MHQNYHFLRHLTESVRPQIVGLTWMECFSQEKDELIIVLAQARGKHNYYRPFFIRTSLRPEFACLNFPDAFNRARQNSVDLFGELTDLQVTGVRQFTNERAFAIELENGYSLVFKLFGNRSNVVLFKDEAVTDVFHNKLVSDNNLVLSQLDRVLDQTWMAYQAAQFDHRKLFPTFGKEVNAYLDERFREVENSPETRWAVVQDTLKLLASPTYYLSEWNYLPTLTLVPLGNIQRQHTDPVAAVNDFYAAFNRSSIIGREKGEALRILQKQILRTQSYIDDTFQKLVNVDEGVKNEELGHILMANLHQIPERAEQVELYDFYRDKPIIIKLKSDLNPQKNAENYYRKSKNERIEIEKMQENVALREAELAELKEHLATIEGIENLKELRKYQKVNQLIAENIVQTPAQLFKQFEVEGYVILVGKNAKNNDLLTKQFTYKEDLWLHARDVTGSHVVIKHRAGRKFPNSVIERAAQLAAWFSKRRHETLCPVIVVPKKYVRKPKGFPEGQVVLDKEEVVMVEPIQP
jgi:predicted ribosome quality control (RQC) complex YloA/Tae2 family protein